MSIAMRAKIALAAPAAAALVGTGAAGLWLQTKKPPMRISIAKADLDQGARLYADNCASCHGANL